MTGTDSSAYQIQCLKELGGIVPFGERIREAEFYPLKSQCSIKTLQVNVGKVCNLMCKHCHVEAGPHRTESMTWDTMARCIQVLFENDIPNLDITGGAPELNPNFTWLVEEARKLDINVILRSNLTVMGLDQYTSLPEFLAENSVEITCSLPFYDQKEADRQRGQGVFLESINVLTRLSRLGYGREGSPLRLNLVYNPNGAYLPPPQSSIETDYRRVLLNQYGISFNNLYTITNVPVGRFLTFLNESGNLQRYVRRLAGSFNPLTISKVMCREQISVGWDGQLYDCDFNQMLGLKCSPGSIEEFDREALQERRIILGNHCYACTAGAGSSCGGAIAVKQ